MPEQVWYRSLYWRIGLGFIACAAGLLIAQTLFFLWLTNPGAGALPAGAPQRLAALVASDLSTSLDADPALDIGRYVEEQFGHVTRPLVIVLRDGRVIVTRRFSPSPVLLRAARARLEREQPREQPREAAAGSEAARDPAAASDGDAGRDAGRDPVRDQVRDQTRGQVGGPGRERGRDQDRPAAAVAADRDPAFPEGFRDRDRGRSPFGRIVVRGQVVGVVTAPFDGPPWLAALREHGPTLAIVGIVLLLAGTTGMAFFVFRPAQRRLRGLQRAAAALGGGQISARAPEQGGDEVAALAHAFNQMAGDLEARVRELRESDRARRQLLADVSHELMTPLTAIRGYLETLAMPRAVRSEADRDRYLQIVMDETLRLESIIGDLLELARLEGGGLALQHEAVPVDWLFARAADRHGPAIREKQITLDVHVEPGTPPIDGDGRRLEQAIQNLVANAVRHTPSGGRITLSAEPVHPSQRAARPIPPPREAAPPNAGVNAGPHGTPAAPAISDAPPDTRPRLRIIVRDTGPGIPPEHLPLIFDRFYKVDASREHQAGGSGLGLSIVKAIVERHGGRITAASRPAPTGLGTGALFEIILPGAPPETGDG